jgi:hypothetical protein
MATPERRSGGGIGGISLGGIIVIIGIILLFVTAFGGFARGRWY